MSRLIRLVAEKSSGSPIELLFKVRETAVAIKWSDCIRAANQNSALREKERLYNFPGHKNYDENYIINNINRSINKINEVFPDHIPFNIDRNNVQNSVNKIHTFFADTNFDKSVLTSQLTETWNELNSWLHAYEAYLRGRATELWAGLPTSNIVLTWHNNFKLPLATDDYHNFTIEKKFGTCYVNYCQTGRHLLEMFLAQDDVASDEHILPLRFVSADTYIWLGPTYSSDQLKLKEDSIKTWFLNNEEKFNSLGLFWGDPQLAIGWIPVADLVEEKILISDQRSLIEKFSQVDEISKFEELVLET
jgi:hypothetical protein